MRLSTRKIIGVSVIALLGEVATIFITTGVLKDYLQVIVLMIAILAGYILFGWTRPRRTNKLVAILVILAAVVFQLATFLLLGLKLGWVHNIYQWGFTNLFQVFLPVTLTIVTAEILRGELVEHGRGSLLAVITIGVTIWLMEIIMALPLYNLAEGGAVFNLIVLVVGPSLLSNVLLTYIAYAYDYRINIAYRLIMGLPTYLLPILPDSGVYLPVLFEIGLVVLLALSLVGVHKMNGKALVIPMKRVASKRVASDQSQRAKRIAKWASISVVAATAVLYVGLMSGLFKFYFLAIGSGSMEPNLYRGDMILVEKSKNYSEMNEGDILVYRHSNAIMVHRISEVEKAGNNYVFHTKGDNNPSEDVWEVEQDDIIGLARGKIALFGYPTLWLNELFNKE